MQKVSVQEAAELAGFIQRLDAHCETKVIDGEAYVLAYPLKADVALLHARKADAMGNLVYEKTARNFNPLMATAAALTIVEVDEIVETGMLSPEEIVTPYIYVDVLVPQNRGAVK